MVDLPLTRIPLAEAAAELGIDKLTLRVLIRDKIKPLGDIGLAVRATGRGYTYIVYRELLDKVKAKLYEETEKEGKKKRI